MVRSRLQPRWTATDRMVADGLTKDKGEPLDLLRSVFRSACYQLADEQLVLDRKKEERLRRQELRRSRKNLNMSQPHVRDENPEQVDACLFFAWPTFRKFC